MTETQVGTNHIDGINETYMLLAEFVAFCDYFNVGSIK